MTDKTDDKKNLPAVRGGALSRLEDIYRKEYTIGEIGEAIVKSPWYLVKAMIDAGKLGVDKVRGSRKPRVRGGAAPAKAKLKVDTSQRDAFNSTLPKGAYAVFRSNGEQVIVGADPDIVLVALDDRKDMSRTLLMKESLNGGIFDGLEAQDIQLAQSELVKCSFKGTKARRADFREATITDGSFESADLRGADFSGTKIVASDPVNGRVSFKGAQLDGLKVSVDTKFDGADFSEADVSKVVIVDEQGRTIPGARLSKRGTVVYENLEAMFQREDADREGRRALPASAEEINLPDDERKMLEEFRASKKQKAIDEAAALRAKIEASLPEGLNAEEKELLIKRRIEAASGKAEQPKALDAPAADEKADAPEADKPIELGAPQSRGPGG